MNTLDIATQSPGGAHAVPQPERVELPRNFTFAGKTLRGRRVTEGQLVAIQMSKNDGTDALVAAVRTVIRSAVGEANWLWMNEQLLLGVVEFAEMADVLTQLSGKTGD
ncbi:hypothetical protein [Streptomyces scopuliridis]|uniref:Uncharacterized protein n=1 Tax=Streptomyces scopuliridis TaxID=452529 RepID=A0ACD4ZPD7_9ACTN|nr:hypothetical protein [Streptomyces scopuliridis]WSC00055.1 hypothetical protein OG835_25720 [Streptomyces scopuliridis]